MTNTDRIKRLETAVERLCDIIYRTSKASWAETELVKHYVSGKLDEMGKYGDYDQ